MRKKANESNNMKNDYRFLKAVEITPQDDTFHGNIKLVDIEWWYFDALLDNGYSIQIGLRIYHFRNIGIVRSIINIYKNGKVKVTLTKINHSKPCFTKIG